MKKILIISSIFLLLSIKVKAGEGFKYFNIYYGFLYPASNSLTLSYEYEGLYHRSTEIYLDYYFHSSYLNEELTSYYHNYSIGLALKGDIARNRNLFLKYRIGFDLGIDNNSKFIPGIEPCLMVGYTFPNQMTLYAIQKNEFAFWSQEQVRTGASVGLKIPLNY